VESISARSIVDAVPTGAVTRKAERRRRLSPAALAIIERDVHPAYSPIVIVGVVRLIDLVMISLIGLGLSFAFSTEDIAGSWRCLLLASVIAAATAFMFQVLNLYQIQHFQARPLRIAPILICWALVFATVFGGAYAARMVDASLQMWCCLTSLDRPSHGNNCNGD
jgi:hypothetical protein